MLHEGYINVAQLPQIGGEVGAGSEEAGERTEAVEDEVGSEGAGERIDPVEDAAALPRGRFRLSAASFSASSLGIAGPCFAWAALGNNSNFASGH